MNRVIAILALVIGFGCGPSARQRALNVTLASLNATRDGFVAWDEQRQSTIVDEAQSLEQSREALKAYRTKRVPVVRALLAAYAALAVAAVDDKKEAWTTAVQALGEVTAAINGLKEAPDVAP